MSILELHKCSEAMALCAGGLRGILVLVTGITAVIVGLLVFIQGFLLTRYAFFITSECEDFTGYLSNADCWLPRTYNRAVVLLIDGLRYDFASYNSAVHMENATHFLNKMPVFQNIIDGIEGECNGCAGNSHPWRGIAFLSKFIADAPTTTMQRLKGLITGGLPTFIDIAQNFDSARISEDNIIYQLKNNHRNITILGDDTWGSLFPDSFSRSFLYPSFNVRDLDTVDNGILLHLNEELQKNDTQLLVAHFLGVDHAGHRYGTDHIRMEEKLRQMDTVVRDVAKSISSDTILLVLGDHGMTASGDHGGDSSSEVTAALFVYSPGFTTIPGDNRHSFLDAKTGDSRCGYAFPAVVQQVSLVPTLALLLGVPIPYSSVGAIIPHLFSGTEKQLQALSLNVHQVHRYLNHYKEMYSKNKFPQDMWDRLTKLKRNIEELDNVDNTNYTKMTMLRDLLDEEIFKDSERFVRYRKKLHEDYLALAKAMCAEVWATFDVNQMICGILLMTVTISNLFCVAFSVTKQIDTQLYFLKGNLILLFIIFSMSFANYFIHIPVFGYLTVLFSGVVLVFHMSRICSLSVYAAYKDVLPLALLALLCIGSLSNSFIVHEDTIISFALVSLFALQTVRLLLVHKTKTFDKGRVQQLDAVTLPHACVALAVFLCCCASLRYGRTLYRCREEQMPECTLSTAYLPLSSIPSSLQNSRYLTGVLTLALLTYLPRWWLAHCGNINGSRCAVLAARYLGGLCAVMICAYWPLEALKKPTPLLLSYTNYLPRVVYASALLCVLVIFIKPLMLFQLTQNNRRRLHNSTSSLIIPELFRDLKAEYSSQSGSDADNTPIVYGLATGVSAPVLTVARMLLLVLAMLVGDGLILAVAALVILATGWCVLHALICFQSPVLDSVMRLRWINPVFWFVLSTHCFYSLGHQAAFPSIPWSAAFVGFIPTQGESAGTVLPAVLVLLHTYGGQLVLAVLLPLLCVTPLALAAIVPALKKNKASDSLKRGEFDLSDRPEVAVGSITATAAAYLAMHAVKVLFSCIACLFLRRHLMVWKVFAPQLVFEAVGLLMTAVAVPLGLLLTFRALGAVTAWTANVTAVKIKPL